MQAVSQDVRGKDEYLTGDAAALSLDEKLCAANVGQVSRLLLSIGLCRVYPLCKSLSQRYHALSIFSLLSLFTLIPTFQ